MLVIRYWLFVIRYSFLILTKNKQQTTNNKRQTTNNYQLDFTTPGSKPLCAHSRSTWRDRPKSR
ncbi:MAG TPA: hypothetical protein DCL61_30100 [Cyanobacteria bacterium UBA12227]|nr:hypothetical protein [Cyanobacteria bacterium UBA12227]HAX90253.1 hypothetical protein [Cyanobacteria bacterium UBA11370]